MFQHRSTPIFISAVCTLFAVLTLVWTLMVDLTTGLFLAVFVTIPTAILGWFILSLILYLRGKRRGDEKVPALKSRLTVATVLLVFLAVMIALLFGFFALAISHM